jgi:hypothetical protein
MIRLFAPSPRLRLRKVAKSHIIPRLAPFGCKECCLYSAAQSAWVSRFLLLERRKSCFPWRGAPVRAEDFFWSDEKSCFPWRGAPKRRKGNGSRPSAGLWPEDGEQTVYFPQSLYRFVERYRSPVSGRMTTMTLPAFSGRFAMTFAA